MEQKIPLHKIDASKMFIKWRDIKVVPNTMEQAHRHSYFQVMIFDEAKGQHEIDFESYSCVNKSLHFVGLGRVHKVSFNQDLKGGVFLFPEEIFGSSNYEMGLLASFKYFQIGNHPVLKLNDVEYEHVVDLKQKIREALSDKSFDLAKYLLFALLCKVRDIYTQNETVSEHTRVPAELLMFKKIVGSEEGAVLELEAILKRIGVTSNRLSNLCNQAYGKTASNLLRERKLLEAKRLLVYTGKQVKEVAYACGFEDVAYFNRFFKKYTAQTPMAFRKGH